MITNGHLCHYLGCVRTNKINWKSKAAIDNADNNSYPADRLIAATSVLNQAPVVTADQNLRNASIVETIW